MKDWDKLKVFYEHGNRIKLCLHRTLAQLKTLMSYKYDKTYNYVQKLF